MTLRNETLSLEGIHCAGCETLIEEALQKLPGVTSACASLASRSVAAKPDRPSRWRNTLKFLALFAVVGGLVFGGIKLMPGLMMHMLDPRARYSMVLLVGFLTGFHCIGMCGSFVVSYATAVAGRGKLALVRIGLLTQPGVDAV